MARTRDEGNERPPGRLARQWTRVHTKATALAQGTAKWLENRRHDRPLLDLAFRFSERDREVDGSVVGSAVALRVFLFFVPLLLIAVGALGFLAGRISAADASGELGVSGGMADQIETALQQSSTTRWTALVTGLIGAVWAGRSLSKVLVVANRRAWRLPVRARQSTLRVLGGVAGLIAAIGLLSTVANRVREASGIAIGTTMMFGVAIAYVGAWFIVGMTLPRPPSDPSALLPGAVLVGAVLAMMQWFVQFYLPPKMAHASQLYGGIGVTIVTLGWFFIIGRLFVASFVLNAVVFERFGSLSEFVFGLPGLRRIPKRWPRVGRFFGLDQRTDDA